MVRRGRLPIYDDDEIPTAMFRDYMTMTGAEVADKYHCSLSTVAKYCKKIKNTPEGQKIIEEYYGNK